MCVSEMIGPVCGPFGFCGLALSPGLCVSQAKPGCAVTDHLRDASHCHRQMDGVSPTPPASRLDWKKINQSTVSQPVQARAVGPWNSRRQPSSGRCAKHSCCVACDDVTPGSGLLTVMLHCFQFG